MNKYQILKYAVIGLTFTSRITATAATYSKDYRYETVSLTSEKIKQVLIDYGNQTWSQECAQQALPQPACQDTSEGVLINA